MIKLDDILGYVKSICDCNPILAGGAVRDTLLGIEPQDYDVFCLDSDTFKLERQFAHVNTPYTGPFKRHKRIAAELNTRLGKIQIMSTRHTTTEQVLADTDWNVSAYAYDGTLSQLDTVDSIAPGKDLRLLKVTNPIATMGRGFMFSKRYDMVFRSEDIVALCHTILEQPNKRRTIRMGRKR